MLLVDANARYDFAALEVRELNHAGAQSANAQTAPRIGFHWGGRVASQIMLETNGEIQIRNNPGTGYEDFRAQIGYFQGDVRTPRYYDSNNTGYYGDFASTSIMNTLDIRGEVYNDGWFRNDTNGRGLYNTATSQYIGIRTASDYLERCWWFGCKYCIRIQRCTQLVVTIRGTCICR